MVLIKDKIDTLISKINWKVGKFSFLPIVFGLVMASLDVVMMFACKFIHLGSIPYSVGLTIATLAYSLQPYIFIKAMNYGNMTATNLIWNLSSDVIVTLSGIFVFSESIKGLRWLAILMSLVSLTLFAYTDD
jgi:multidrug transporter EmrE-like cation transporter